MSSDFFQVLVQRLSSRSIGVSEIESKKNVDVETELVEIRGTLKASARAADEVHDSCSGAV